MQPGRCIALLALALALAPAAAAAGEELPVPEEPDLAALGIPAYPGMRFEAGGGGTGATTAGSSGGAPAGGPALSGLFRYTSDDPFERVAAFYERELGPPEVRVKDRDLTEGRRGQEIPVSARGRRKLFRVRGRDGAPSGPAGADPAELLEHALHQALGAANVLVSDHGIDSESGAVRATTTIEILLFR